MTRNHNRDASSPGSSVPAGGTRSFTYDPAAGALGRKRLLLHSCCGPCSTSVIERLRPDYDITVFYYNPCITDQQEYEKRKMEQIRFLEELNCKIDGDAGHIDFLEGQYEPGAFLEFVKGHEADPEGGERCDLCILMRLTQTAETASQKGYPVFTSTLSVSPHKNYQVISRAGRDLAREKNIEFLDMDFKKNAGFQRSVQISKEYNLYRQDYCGCHFSKQD